MADEPPSAEMLRADMQGMLGYIQGARIVSMARELAIGRVQAWLVRRFWVGLATAALALVLIALATVAFGIAPRNAAFLHGLVLLVLAARIGAIVSIGRRVHTDNLGAGVAGDSIYTLAVLGAGRPGLALALMSANAFGIVILLLFAAGLPSAIGFNAGVFPRFVAGVERERRDRALADAETARQREEEAIACRRGQTPDGPAAKPSETPSGPPAGTPAILPSATSANAPDETPVVSAAPASSEPNPSPSPSATPSSAAADCDVLSALAATAAATARASALLAETPVAPASASGTRWLALLRDAMGLLDVEDVFKLLLWAFLAGFLEKFVPDMLDRLGIVSKETKRKQGEPG